jgi:glycosyltransferase involved in cell wall biosynthesis
MLLRVVDYAGNPGGGIRFVVEAVAAIAALPNAPHIEFISDGQAFTSYETAFRTRCPCVRVRRLRPLNNPRLSHRWYHSLPGMTVLPALLWGKSRASLLRYVVSEDVCDGADAVWLPWIHGHQLVAGHARVIATYHDTIAIDFAGILPPDVRHTVMALDAEWLTSQALITVTSKATAHSLERLYHVSHERFPVVRLSGKHSRLPVKPTEAKPAAPWQSQPYFLCPANTSIHKNHEVLLQGYAQWGGKIPLVLTGAGTDFLTAANVSPRSRHLRTLARNLRLDSATLIGLGYISDTQYYSLLYDSRAVIMPTLAEGGGSFPAWEAIELGIPVACSDIPVLRETMPPCESRLIWFDPHSPHDLARALNELPVSGQRIAGQATGHAPFGVKTWTDVAEDYVRLFSLVPPTHTCT